MKEQINLNNLRSMYKDSLLISEKVAVKRSKIHRWGVFAIEKIEKHEIIEEFPYFFVFPEEMNNTQSIIQYSYEFESGYVIGMGHCGLYNHNVDSNIDYQVDKLNEIMIHYATRDIDVGEELTLNYGLENANFFANDDELLSDDTNGEETINKNNKD